MTDSIKLKENINHLNGFFAYFSMPSSILLTFTFMSYQINRVFKMTTFFPVFKCCQFKHELSVNGSPCNNNSIDGSFIRHFYCCLVCAGTEVLIMRFQKFQLVLDRALIKIEKDRRLIHVFGVIWKPYHRHQKHHFSVIDSVHRYIYHSNINELSFE